MSREPLNHPSPEVSFIIPCYNCRRTIGFALKAVFEQETSLPFEVIVVDSSANPIKEWIDLRFRKVRLIASSERLSAGAARNLGASASKGRFLAFLDADTVALPNWLSALYPQLQKQLDLAVAGGAVQNGNPESMASRIQYWIEFSEFLPGSPAGRRRFLSSSNILIRREAFEQAGGFDPAMTMAEDLLLMKALEGGIYFDNSTGIKHSHRSRWALVSQHLHELGYWSGKLRSNIDLPGSWLKRAPLLSLTLPFYRLALILLRLWRGDRRQAIQAVSGSPILLAGLFHWTFGFIRGLRST